MSQFDKYDVFMKILALIEQDQSVSPKRDELVDRLALLIKPIREVHPSAAADGEGSEAIEKMPEPFYFISYSRVDGEDFALKLGDQLAAGPPSICVWLDQHRLQPGIDYDEQLVDALRSCEGCLYVMTRDSTRSNSECKKEWTRALKYKKPIIPLLVHRDAELPFRLEPRHYIDFTNSFDAGLARLRKHVRWRTTAEGVLHTLKERLTDALRGLARAGAAEKASIEKEIYNLEEQIEQKQRAISKCKST